MRCLVPTVGTEGRLATLLRAQGHDVVELRVGEIVSVPEAVPPDADWLAIASKNAISALLAEGVPSGVRLAAVGGRTAQALRAQGLAVDFIPSVATAEALRAELAEHAPGARVHFFKGYENRPVPLAGPIDLGAYDAAYFTCASSVERVFAQATGVTRCYAIGPTTAAALRRHGIDPIVSPEPTLEALGVRA